MIDEAGELQEELDRITGPLKPKEIRLEFLKESIKKSQPGPDPWTMPGKEFTAVAGQRNNSTTIDVLKAFKVLKRDVFLAIAKLGSDGLKGVTTTAQYEALATTSRTGPRTLQFFRKPPEAA